MVSPEVVERISSTAQISCLGVVNEQGYRASGETQAFSGFFPRDACLSSEERFFRVSRKNLPPQILREIPVIIHPDRYKKVDEITLEEKEVITNTLLPARNSLRTMARFQGKVVDDLRDEEPGKMPHELRSWDYDGQILADTTNNRVLEKLASCKWCVDGEGLRYYGSIDSTPLFVM